MVEEDAVVRVQPVGLAVVDGDPVAVDLGGTVGAARVEGRGLALRHLTHEPEHLGGRGLVEAAPVRHPEDAHRLPEPQLAERVGVGRVLRRLEAHLDVALRGQVVDRARSVRSRFSMLLYRPLAVIALSSSQRELILADVECWDKYGVYPRIGLAGDERGERDTVANVLAQDPCFRNLLYYRLSHGTGEWMRLLMPLMRGA
jgi:hypothetical protein